MQVQLDALTTERLQASLAGQPGAFKMFYDTEDCGCNGVLVLQIVDGPNATDIVYEQEPFTFIVDRQQESLFDKVMRIQAEVNYPSYKVTSDSTLYGSNVRIRDKRQQAVQ